MRRKDGHKWWASNNMKEYGRGLLALALKWWVKPGQISVVAIEPAVIRTGDILILGPQNHSFTILFGDIEHDGQ
jgi:hypothetical protein